MKKFTNYRRIVQVSDSESDDDIVSTSPTMESSIRTNSLCRSRIFCIPRKVAQSPKTESVPEHPLSTAIDDSDFLDASDDNDIFNSTKSSTSENCISDNETCERKVQKNLEDSLSVSNNNTSCNETDLVNNISDSEDSELAVSSNLKDSFELESSNNASCHVIDVSSDSSDDFVDAKSEPVVCVPTSGQKDNGDINLIASPVSSEDSEKNLGKDTGANVALTSEIANNSEDRRSTYFSAFDLDDLRKSLPFVPKQKKGSHHQQKEAVSVKEENTATEEENVSESEGNVSDEILYPLATKWQGSFLEKKSEHTKAPLVKQEDVRPKVCDEFASASNQYGSQLSLKSEDVGLKNIQNTQPAVIKQEEFSMKRESGSSEKSIPEGMKSPQTLKTQMIALQNRILKTKGILKSTNITTLPDRGVRLQMSLTKDENELKKLRNDLQISEEWHAKSDKAVVISAKDKIKQEWGKELHGVGNMRPLEPKNFNSMTGTKASEYEVSGRLLTVDALEQLHKSLETRPADNIFDDDPKGLRSSYKLMAHQKHALAWLRWRERQKPRGGILADDMGLGKTLTMISLILKSLEEDERDSSDSENSDDSQVEEEWMQSKDRRWENGGTLVVCPASLVNQWESEIKSKCKSDILKVVVHHGSSREKSARRLSKFDVVVTTYSIVRNEAGFVNARDSDICESKKAALHKIRWNRIILDEGHVIRNHKNKTSVAVNELRGRHRWVLTGTPLHNKELDVYALLKFLRCSPFDEISVWRRWVDNKNASGLHRLNAIMNAIMLRRTKDQLQRVGSLQCLPEKNVHIITVKLSEEEFAVYETVLNYSKTLFAQFLHQRAEKEEQNSNGSLLPFLHTTSGKKSALNVENTGVSKELATMYNHMNNIQDVKTFQILVLLLRLRQLCCHPGLIKAMLEEDAKEVDGIEDDSGIDQDMLSKLSNLSLTEANTEDAITNSDANEIEKKVLVESNPVFDLKRCSSKMQAVFDKLSETVLGTEDKAVIISQWTSMLEILAEHLQEMGVRYTILSGSVPVKDRGDIIDKFNRPDRGPKVMLLSLTAGGVGLNLVGANHLFLFDVHWNPQLEAQACDRVYRVGQKKPVHIYKFFCEETIEARIKKMQDNKLALASEVLTGAKQRRKEKLSLDDLRVLFGF
ncbi:transcription termination factor 2 [Schistocerca gregaria]|uniref:transcription termination factor 2 n=1 Tax=Schistocerca gregaria TaxID=7010 RepID=UPI00211EE982|nr:transcription termination factor 2 [Schistocerca gregaria]